MNSIQQALLNAGLVSNDDVECVETNREREERGLSCIIKPIDVVVERDKQDRFWDFVQTV